MTNSNDDDSQIIVDYDDLIRRIKHEYNREPNKTEELARFMARMIALLTIARDEYIDNIKKEDYL